MTGGDIVLSKWAALEGTAVIAKAREDDLRREFSDSFIRSAKDFTGLISVEKEETLAESLGASGFYRAGEGGIYRSLWEFAEILGVGMDIYLRDIPIRQETVEIANFLDIDPYKLLSGGSLIMTAERGHDLVRMLKNEGINAAVIGSTNGSKDRVILNDGMRRFISPRDGDEIFKVVAGSQAKSK